MELFRKGKTCIIAKFYRTDLVICSHSRERKILSYRQINTMDPDMRDHNEPPDLDLHRLSFIFFLLIQYMISLAETVI